MAVIWKEHKGPPCPLDSLDAVPGSDMMLPACHKSWAWIGKRPLSGMDVIGQYSVHDGTASQNLLEIMKLAVVLHHPSHISQHITCQAHPSFSYSAD